MQSLSSLTSRAPTVPNALHSEIGRAHGRDALRVIRLKATNLLCESIETIETLIFAQKTFILCHACLGLKGFHGEKQSNDEERLMWKVPTESENATKGLICRITTC